MIKFALFSSKWYIDAWKTLRLLWSLSKINTINMQAELIYSLSCGNLQLTCTWIAFSSAEMQSLLMWNVKTFMQFNNKKIISLTLQWQKTVFISSSFLAVNRLGLAELLLSFEFAEDTGVISVFFPSDLKWPQLFWALVFCDLNDCNSSTKVSPSTMLGGWLHTDSEGAFPSSWLTST